MSAELDLEWLRDQVVHVVLCAVDDKPDQCLDALDEVARRYGARGVYTAFVGLAEYYAQTSGEADHRGDDVWFGFEVLDIRTGATVDPDEVDDESRDVMLAMRFIAAVLNRDRDQSVAIFNSLETPLDAARMTSGMLKLVGAAGRWKLEQAGEQ